MLCSFPLWMLILAIFVADSMRSREKRHHILSVSVVIGALTALTSLSYRVCGSGNPVWPYETIPVAVVYRGYPFPWFGWIGGDVFLYPTLALLGNLLIWFTVAFLSIQLLSFMQWLLQFRLARSDKLVIAGGFVVLLPIILAVVSGGRGC
jgi:hypothetical protein